jgi:hypothetical protein
LIVALLLFSSNRLAQLSPIISDVKEALRGVEKPQTEVCQENWQCDEWSSCSSGGKQTRSCEDVNNCETMTGKPSEERDCMIEEVEYDGFIIEFNEQAIGVLRAKLMEQNVEEDSIKEKLYFKKIRLLSYITN